MQPSPLIPYVDLIRQHQPIKEALLKRFEHVIDHADFILGSEVEEFEYNFKQKFNYPYAVGVNSGTDALFLGLKALGIGGDDEVITVSNSFLTTTSAIIQTGAKPVFVDINKRSLMDVSLLSKALSSKTKAILPVHLMGSVADMKAIKSFATEHDLHVIEDCAQAVGAKRDGDYVGQLGDIGAFSLHPLKTLGAVGDAGILVCHDETIYKKVLSLRNVGLVNRNTCEEWGINSRLDSIQAAALNVKFEFLDEWTEKRRANASLYTKLLADTPGLVTPDEDSGEYAVFHTYVIQVDRRDELKSFLESKGIGTAIHYPTPIHLQPAAKYLGYAKGDLPITESNSRKILSLPVYPNLRTSDIEIVAKHIKEFTAAQHKVLIK